MGNSQPCSTRFYELRAFVNEKLKNDSTIIIMPDNNSCFTILFKGHTDPCFDGVLISVPADPIGNEESKLNTTFEIELLLNNSLTYVDDLGYNDVCRFYTMEEVVVEIKRLAYIQLHVPVSVLIV
jgi:hypothetical protein